VSTSMLRERARAANAMATRDARVLNEGVFSRGIGPISEA
jgi:hypothetical protein